MPTRAIELLVTLSSVLYCLLLTNGIYAASLSSSAVSDPGSNNVAPIAWQQLCDLCKAAMQVGAAEGPNAMAAGPGSSASGTACIGRNWDWSFLRRCSKIASDILFALKSVVKEDMWDELGGIQSVLDNTIDQPSKRRRGASAGSNSAYLYLKRNSGVGIDPMYGVVVG